VQGGHGIDDRELHEDADPNGNLVGRQDFLALDRQVTAAHINEYDFDLGLALEPEKSPGPREELPPGQLVPAGAQDLGENAVLVPEAAMGVLDKDFSLDHDQAIQAKEKKREAPKPVYVEDRQRSDLEDLSHNRDVGCDSNH
jgi:hypothetical protein